MAVRRKPADSADDRSKVFSIDILHRQEKSSFGFTNVKHAANVGMRDLPSGTHFGVKPRERSGILGKRLGKKFQCDDLAECQIFGAVNLTHSSAARQGHDAVAFRDNLPRGEAAAADGV
ncbi:MAG: hypothetical protein JWN63_2591 [Candidatus Acidoferrum typicum]|nr:hypothetical protein [Candidatus Acidoferrum typicum]